MNVTEQIEPEVTEKLYDLDQLKKTFGENTEFIISLADIYINTFPANSKLLVQATEVKDWLMVSKLAHKIKPTIDTMNIFSITADIRALEKAVKKEVNTDTLSEIAVKVDQVINTVAQQLKYEFNL